jgi:type III restriction enzyme
LSEEDRALLSQGKFYDAAEDTIDRWLNDLRSVANGLSGLSTEIAGSPTAPLVALVAPVRDLLTAAHGEYTALMGEAKRTIDALLTQLRKPDEALSGTPWAEWRQKLQAFRDAYEAAVKRSSVHRERMEQLQTIETRLSTYQKETARLNEEMKSLRTAGDIRCRASGLA